MDKFQKYINSLNIMNSLTEDEFSKTMELLELYAPLVRQSVYRMDEYTEECYENRRQSVSDFINLAIDSNHDVDSLKMAERLADTDHSMLLLKLLDEALVTVRDDPQHGQLYYRILNARYFDCYCKSNEDAFLHAGVSSATYYRHIKKARRYYAAVLWCVVIPHLVLAAQHKAGCASVASTDSDGI